MDTCITDTATMPPTNKTSIYLPGGHVIKDSPGSILSSDITSGGQETPENMQMSPMVKSFLIVGVLFGLVVVLAMIHAYIEYIETQRRRKGTVIVDKGQIVRRRSTLTFTESQPKGRTTRTHSILYVGSKNACKV